MTAEAKERSGETSRSKADRVTAEESAPAPAEPAPSPPGDDRRSNERQATDYNGSCVVHTVSYNVEVLDLSRIGARVRLRQGLMPAAGQSLSLVLMDGSAIDGFVAWAGALEIGLQFREPLRDLQECLHFDEMGSDFYRSVLRFQIARA